MESKKLSINTSKCFTCSAKKWWMLSVKSTLSRYEKNKWWEVFRRFGFKFCECRKYWKQLNNWEENNISIIYTLKEVGLWSSKDYWLGGWWFWKAWWLIMGMVNGGLELLNSLVGLGYLVVGWIRLSKSYFNCSANRFSHYYIWG